MITYCGIVSEVRRTLLDQTAPLQPPSSYEAVRDFAHFRVCQWQNSLPKSLQFGGVNDKYDPTREKRGEYKLRLMLWLRANQLRTIILRKSATSSSSVELSAPPPSLEDTSSTQSMLEIAQATVRVLVYLGKETDIYDAQHRTFNHFLETALSSLLLVVCCSGTNDGPPPCLEDIVAAMDLVSQLSQRSYITRKLHEKLQVIQHVVESLKTPKDETQSLEPPVESRPTTETEAPVETEAAGSQQTSSIAPQKWQLPGDVPLDQSEGIEMTGCVPFPEFRPYPQENPDLTMAPFPTTDFTSPCNLSSISDNLSAGQEPNDNLLSELYLSTDIDGARYHELNDILMDYDGFAF